MRKPKNAMGLFNLFANKRDINEINLCLEKISKVQTLMRNLDYEEFQNMSSTKKLRYESISIVIFDEIKKIDSIVRNGDKSLSKKLFHFDRMNSPIDEINQNIFNEVMAFKERFGIGLCQEELDIWDEYGPNNRNRWH